MELTFKVWYGSNLADACLTTEVAESSYGQPVLVIDGEAFSPVDAAFSIALAGSDAKIVAALAKAGYKLREEPWGLNLKRLRIERGMTQAELGEKLGLPQSRISELESREKPPRDAAMIRKIERALGGEK